MALDVSSKLPGVDSWACAGRRSKRRRGNADVVGQYSDEENLALCLLMLSRGVRGGGAASAVAATEAPSREYECTVCGKVYESYQALGGHKTRHRNKPPSTHPRRRQPPAAAEAAAGGDETSGAGSANARGEKVHRCSLCLRTFPSGQALGGHKRLHYEGGADGRVKNKEQHVVKTKPGATPVLRDFDLNLPADDASSAIGVEEAEIAPPEAKRVRMQQLVVV